MNVEIGAEAALFPEKEYINGIFVAVHTMLLKLRIDKIILDGNKNRTNKISG
jgi:hypothetical protein